MELLPKFVRGRLTIRQDGGGDHPDANLLVAFAEQKLPARDRSVVLAHLAQCSDCRDVVALASAVDRSHNRVDTLTSRRPVGWWTWRWAGVGAIACLTTVVVWRLDWNEKHRPAPDLKSVLVADNQKTAEPQQSAAPSKPSPPVSRSRKQVQTRAASTPLPHPEPIRPALSIAEAPALSGLDPNEEQRGSVSPSFEAPLVPKAQGLVSSDAIQPPFHRLTSPLVSKAAAGSARKSVWELDESGRLRKSEDGGFTWHTVLLQDRIVFYALSVTGPNLWAGGAGGALFHSTDDGLHWVKVEVTDGKTRLKDSITKIDLHEDQSLDLRTGSGSEWVSVDGGLHWQLK